MSTTNPPWWNAVTAQPPRWWTVFRPWRTNETPDYSVGAASGDGRET